MWTRNFSCTRGLETFAMRENVWRNMARRDLETSTVRKKVWRDIGKTGPTNFCCERESLQRYSKTWPRNFCWKLNNNISNVQTLQKLLWGERREHRNIFDKQNAIATLIIFKIEI